MKAEKELFEFCPFSQFRIDFYEADIICPSLICTRRVSDVECIPSAEFCQLRKINTTMEKAAKTMWPVSRRLKKLSEGKALLSTEADDHGLKVLLTKHIKELDKSPSQKKTSDPLFSELFN